MTQDELESLLDDLAEKQDEYKTGRPKPTLGQVTNLRDHLVRYLRTRVPDVHFDLIIAAVDSWLADNEPL